VCKLMLFLVLFFLLFFYSFFLFFFFFFFFGVCKLMLVLLTNQTARMRGASCPSLNKEFYWMPSQFLWQREDIPK
jgi:hypothetical protein